MKAVTDFVVMHRQAVNHGDEHDHTWAYCNPDCIPPISMWTTGDYITRRCAQGSDTGADEDGEFFECDACGNDLNLPEDFIDEHGNHVHVIIVDSEAASDQVMEMFAKMATQTLIEKISGARQAFEGKTYKTILTNLSAWITNELEGL